VRVPTDDADVIRACQPVSDPRLNACLVVACPGQRPAHRAQGADAFPRVRKSGAHAQRLQVPPKVAHHQPNHPVSTGIGRIRLVTVRDEKAHRALTMDQQERLLVFRPHGGQVASARHQLVVASEHHQAASPRQSFHDAVDGPVSRTHGIQVTVLPQLVTITDLYVGIALSLIVLEGALKDGPVGAKGVGTPVITPVQIREKDKAGVVIKLEDGGLMQCTVQAMPRLENSDAVQSAVQNRHGSRDPICRFC